MIFLIDNLGFKIKLPLFRTLAAAVLVMVCSSGQSSVLAEDKEGQPEYRQLINRAVLTVGREIYTAKDAAAMLMIWNMTRGVSERPLKFETDWLKNFDAGDTSRPDPLVMMQNWPEDAKIFFQMSLIWIDVQKLNLFLVREQDISLNLKKFSEQFEKLSDGVQPVIAREILLSGESSKKKWIDSVIRVRSFLRVRGDLLRNKNLLSLGWYWHKIPDGLANGR